MDGSELCSASGSTSQPGLQAIRGVFRRGFRWQCGGVIGYRAPSHWVSFQTIAADRPSLAPWVLHRETNRLSHQRRVFRQSVLLVRDIGSLSPVKSRGSTRPVFGSTGAGEAGFGLEGGGSPGPFPGGSPGSGVPGVGVLGGVTSGPGPGSGFSGELLCVDANKVCSVTIVISPFLFCHHARQGATIRC